MLVKAVLRSKHWGQSSPAYWAKILVIRGIGYKAYVVKQSRKTINTNLCFGSASVWDKISGFAFNKYLVVRAGHTQDCVQPLPKAVFVKILKKDRKLVIYGRNKQQVCLFANVFVSYREPSVYTGRGVREKFVKTMRKAGKKDKQKGK